MVQLHFSGYHRLGKTIAIYQSINLLKHQTSLYWGNTLRQKMISMKELQLGDFGNWLPNLYFKHHLYRAELALNFISNFIRTCHDEFHQQHEIHQLCHDEFHQHHSIMKFSMMNFISMAKASSNGMAIARMEWYLEFQ